MDTRELCQRSAVFVHKILHGAMPAELPIERADKFPLVVNLQTAQALGLTLPPTVLFGADEGSNRRRQESCGQEECQVL
jgi:putative ABC transport system substrate-binding protein